MRDRPELPVEMGKIVVTRLISDLGHRLFGMSQQFTGIFDTHFGQVTENTFIGTPPERPTKRRRVHPGISRRLAQLHRLAEMVGQISVNPADRIIAENSLVVDLIFSIRQQNKIGRFR